MTETNWPKGPWIARKCWPDELGELDAVAVTTQERDEAAALEICTIEAGCDPLLWGEQQAALKLILAAPDLYEALRGLLKLHEAHHNAPEHAAARAALAKACGEDG